MVHQWLLPLCNCRTVRLLLYSPPDDLPVSLQSNPTPRLPLEVGKLALAAVVPQVQEVIEDSFSFPQLNCSPSGSRYFPRSTLRVHPGASQVWASETRLGVSLLFRLHSTLFLNFLPDWTLAESVVSSTGETASFLLGSLLLLFLPFLALAFASLLSLTLDSVHLAGPRRLRLSLNRVDSSLLFISLLSTLRLLLIPPRRISSSPVHFHPEGHSLGSLQIPLYVRPHMFL